MKRFAVKVWVDTDYLEGPDIKFSMSSNTKLDVGLFVEKFFGEHKHYCCYDIDNPEIERFLIDIRKVDEYPFGQKKQLVVDGFDEEYLIEYIFSLYEKDKFYIGITTERAATTERSPD